MYCFLSFFLEEPFNLLKDLIVRLSLASQLGWEKLLLCCWCLCFFALQDQYINHIIKETGVIVVLRGKDSENLGCCLGEASQPLHLYLTSMHLKSLEAAKVLAENLLDTIAAEFGASRISSSKVYGAVPPPQQLLAGVDTSVARSDVHSTLGPNVLAGASHSFASTGVIAPTVAPAVTLQSGSPTYSGVPPPNNMTYPIPPVNGGTFYSGYGDIYPQATPLQQVAFTLKHASSSTLTSTVIKTTSSLDVEMDKRSRRKFQELPVSKAPMTETQNSQQGSKFVKTGLDSLGDISISSIAPPKKVQPGPNGMLPRDQADMPSHFSLSNNMPPPPPKSMLPPPSKNMPPPPPRSMPPPPPKFPSDEILSRNESKTSKELTAPPMDTRSVLPAQLPPKEPKEEKPKCAPVSDTLLKLMDYGDEDDNDDTHLMDSIPKGSPTPCSEQKPSWAV